MRLVVVAPTYNHGSTLAGVLSELSGRGFAVIAIDDGSGDATARVLRDWAGGGPGRWTLTHDRNRGKAEALRSGFDEALRLGFTHAATMDTDGQHDAADLARVVAFAAEHPGSLVLGAREGGRGAPLASRIGRWASNGLVWIESGVRVRDSQTGMRVYPLGATGALRGRWSRYNFETEVLVLAGWEGIPVAEVAVRCIYEVRGGRTTHFRGLRDTAAAAVMHLSLLAGSVRPGRRLAGSETSGTVPRRLARWLSPRRMRDMARGDPESRRRLSASVGFGLFMAAAPIYGVKTVVCVWVAARFRLHPLPVLAVSSLSTPPAGLAFVGLSVCVGSLLLHGRLPDVAWAGLTGASRWSTMNDWLAEWLLGSLAAGVGLGAAGYLAMRVLLRMRGAGAPREPGSAR